MNLTRIHVRILACLIWMVSVAHGSVWGQLPFVDSTISQIQTLPRHQQSAKYVQAMMDYFNQSHASVIVIGEHAINTISSDDDLLNTGKIYKLLGNSYYLSSNYVMALQKLIYAYKIFERIEALDEKAQVLSMIGRIKNRQGETETAIRCHQLAADIFTRLQNTEGMASAYNYLGNVLMDRAQGADVKLAEAYFKKAFQIHLIDGDSLGMSYGYDFLAGNAAVQGNPQKALLLQFKALKLRESVRDSFAIAISYNNIGEAYLGLNQKKEAIPFFYKSIGMAQSQMFTDLEKHTLGLLSQTYSDLGDYKKAYALQNEKIALDRKAIDEQKVKQLAELEIQYKAEKKNAEIASLAREKAILAEKKQVQLKLFLSLLTVVIMGALTLYAIIRQRQKLKVQQIKAEEQRKQTQIMLEAEEKERERIARELHDGVGQLIAATRLNLAGVESEVTPSNSFFQKAVQLLDETGKEVRHISHNLLPASLEQQGLEAALRQFVTKLKSPSTPNITLDTSGLAGFTDTLAQTMVFRIVQEVVTNALKYAQASEIAIQVHADSQILSVLVEDNGVGMDLSKPVDGIGMKNIKARAQVLKAQVQWDSSPGRGTTFVLEAPVTSPFLK